MKCVSKCKFFLIKTVSIKHMLNKGFFITIVLGNTVALFEDQENPANKTINVNYMKQGDGKHVDVIGVS